MIPVCNSPYSLHILEEEDSSNVAKASVSKPGASKVGRQALILYLAHISNSGRLKLKKYCL